MVKIAAALIVKDDTEEKTLKRCLDSVAPHVDKIFITGTKQPQKRIKKLLGKYDSVYSFFPWVNDFSAARNFNFKQVPDEYQWIIWLDADDVLVGGENLHEAAKMGNDMNVKAIFARYLYSVELDKNGRIKNILIEHLRERLVRNDGTFKWIAPIHETLIEQVPSGKTDVSNFYVVHLAQDETRENSLWRNIEILEDAVIKDASDPRPLFYLAKAYFDTREPKVLYEGLDNGCDSFAMELMKDYLRKSGWPEERAQCLEYMAMVHRERKEFKKAHQALLEAENEWPEWMSIYIQQALTYVMEGKWDRALHYIKVAGSIDLPKTTLVIQPKDYKATILEALFHIYLNTGKLEECEKVVEGLVGLLPSNMNMQRLSDIKDVRHRNDLAHWVVKLAHHLKQTGQGQQLKAIINAIPQEIANEPALINLRNEYLTPRTWEDNEVMIYCGPGFEKWSWKNTAKGVGGSEEAVIYLSKELAKLGWKVTVYGDPQEDEGINEGVNWLPYFMVNWNDNFNILVSWRQIGLFDIPVKAKKTYLWNHDLQNQLEYTDERVKKIDKVMFLSRFHRTNVPKLPEDKVMYTANGINI